MASISSVHDNFVRSVLSDKQTAVDYFKSALPANLADKLDFSTLEQLSGSYVSGELGKTLSDVVYSCRRSDGGGSVEVSILVEHKSAPDRYTPVQVGGYLFSGYRQQIKQGRKQLSPIIPVLFYHGKQKWEYRTLENLFGELDQELLGFIPEFQYVYNNLRDTPDEGIEAIRNRYLAMSMLFLKHTFDKRWLDGTYPRILMMGLLEGTEEQQRTFLIYSLVQVEFTEERIKEIIRELPSKIKDSIMSTYEILLEKGRKEGIEKGIEKGKSDVVENLILKLGLSDEQAADVVEVSIDFVRKVRSDLAKRKK